MFVVANTYKSDTIQEKNLNACVLCVPEIIQILQSLTTQCQDEFKNLARPYIYDPTSSSNNSGLRNYSIKRNTFSETAGRQLSCGIPG